MVILLEGNLKTKMEEEKILENITKSINDRLKVPVILTYICVLFLYNWDIIYYLIFENNCASIKIKFIKNEYGSVYFERILICLTISIILIILFTILNTFINLGLKWFYRKDKEITSEIENYEKINSLTLQLSNSIDEIKKLNSQIENLTKINENLSSKNTKINISDISKKDYIILTNFLKSKSDKEKLLYSLNELIQMLKNNPRIGIYEIYKNSTYEHEMRMLVQYLYDLKLMSSTSYRTENGLSTYEALKMGTSFKEFLEIEI